MSCTTFDFRKWAPLLAAGLLVSACQVHIENEGNDAGLSADAEVDVYEPPMVELSAGDLQSIYQMSPEEFAAPAEVTNAVAGDPRAVRLGQFLFFDKRVSGNGTVACSTCHRPDHGFADRVSLSRTSMGVTTRNSPSLLNVGYNHWYFWDGRSDSLWSQATVPIEAENEMGSSRLEVAHLMAADEELRQAYEDLFGPLPDLSDTDRFPQEGRPVPDDPDHPHHQAWASMSAVDQETINRVFTNITKALSAYELELVSLDSPFDTFVEGLRTDDIDKKAALSYSAQRGLKVFLNEGRCDTCHQKAMLTTHTFHNLGLASPDLGRYEGTASLLDDPFNADGEYSDANDSAASLRLSSVQQLDKQRGQFRTPMLRNVALSPPYMHAGQLETLEDVVRFYSELDQEPAVGTRDNRVTKLDLSEQQIADVVTFLESLTGSGVPAEYTEAPQSPLID